MNRTKWIAWLSLALVVAGPFVYLALLGNPFLQRTGVPAWLLMSMGAALGLASARRHPRRWTRAIAGIELVLLALFAVGFFYLSALPGSGQFEQLTQAPDFSIPDQDGHAVSLHQELTKGPVMLVFYRGFW